MGHEGLQKPPQNHSIRYIRTLELVETQHTRFLGNGRCYQRQRIKIIAVLHFDHMHALMDILHEIVEMNTRLGHDIRRQGLVEQIHEHCFPTPDISIHIQAFRKVLRDG